MIDRGSHNILGVRVHAVDYEAAVNKIVDAAEQRLSLIHISEPTRPY